MPRREDYRLRTLETGDLEKVLQWRNSERIRASMYTDHMITMDEHLIWFERLRQNQNTIYKIFEFNGHPVGVVCFTDIDQKNNKCIWGFYLGEEGIPQGTGSIMGFLGLEYGFEKVGIRKICAEVFAFNFISVRFHKKLGFIEEGRLVRHILKSRDYEDVVLFTLFAEQWLHNKHSLEKLVFSTKDS